MSFTLALGPFEAALFGPQRLLVTVAADRIVDVVYRDGYNERSCAARMTRLDTEQALQLAGQICGRCGLAHMLAFCRALEALAEVSAPARAAYMRCAVAELERAASHLHSAAAVFDALGHEPGKRRLQGLHHAARNALQTLSGAAVASNFFVPGGIRRDIDDEAHYDTQNELRRINQELYRTIDGFIDARWLLRRTVNIGLITRQVCEEFGLRGPLARAAGCPADTRRDAPYEAYDQLTLRVIVQDGGDVYARLVTMLLEALESIKLAEEALANLPGGDWCSSAPVVLRAGAAEALVEAPRGQLRYRIESDGLRLTGVSIDAPRQLDRLVARTLLDQALLDNALVITLSVDPCTACAEC